MQASLDRIFEGFKKFHTNHYAADNGAKMRDLVENGQHPEYYFISCSDSRYDPNQLPSLNPGDAFISQHIAALVPPHEDERATTVSSCVEFAVNVLGVKHIIIMGHTQCGGIAALVKDQAPDSVKNWIDTAKDVANNQDLAQDLSTRCDHAEKQSVVWSLNNLKSYPAVKAALAEGRLQIHGWRFDILTGTVEAYDENKDEFSVFFAPE